jgi:hypothetical protein
MAGTKISLADIKRAAEAKYGPVDIDLGDGMTTLRLLPVLRLPRHKRDALSHVMDDAADGTERDAVDGFREWLRIVATDEELARRGADERGDDLSYWKILQEEWAERTQVGEA